MNIEAYISSGAVEAYVLGIATAQEVQEIEANAELYPELKAAIIEQQIALEQFATSEAVPVPPALKNKIWSAIEADTLSEKETAKIAITPNVASTIKKEKGWQQYAMAASIALLVAVGATNIWMQKQQSKMSAALASMTQKQEKLLVEINKAKHQAEMAKNALEVMQLPQLKKIALAGVGTHTDAKAMLYWDGATGNVFLNMGDMPSAPAGKEYQLWAIVDGKPVDAGMYTAEPGLRLLQMKTFAKAEMFAITIEKAGGSPTPTMEQMVLAGKTS